MSRKKLNWDNVNEIRKRYEAGEKQAHLAMLFGVSQSTVRSIVLGFTWKQAKPVADEANKRLLDRLYDLLGVPPNAS